MATIEAVKMEAPISAPVGGTVEPIALSGPRSSTEVNSCWCLLSATPPGRQKLLDAVSCPDNFRQPSRVGLDDPSR